MRDYLRDGWYRPGPQPRLRDEVVDGAIDTAGLLFRAAVPLAAVTSLAELIRHLGALVSPAHHQGVATSPATLTALSARVDRCTVDIPPLQALAQDCLQQVTDGRDLRAFYLHLLHITQMMQLLTVAKLDHAYVASGSAAPAADRRRPAIVRRDDTPRAR